MENIRLALLLHFYQPWWQDKAILGKIVNQCYRPILNMVRELDGFCFTANMNLCLLEQLAHDFPDVVSDFKRAVYSGKIELVGSTAHHPIFPLIPEQLQSAQLEEDYNGKKDRFDIESNCGGVFLPEMAFGRENVKILRTHGYRWTVLDDEPFNAMYGYVPYDHVINSDGLNLYMRSNYWSNMISSGKFNFNDIRSRMDYELPNWTRNNQAYLIIAMDAETFGHHHPDLITNFLKPMLIEWANYRKIVPITELENIFPSQSSPTMPDGSWSTTKEDIICKNDPYPLWKSRFNIYHSMLWDLVNSALIYFPDCRLECLKITSSCHWWWISGRPNWKPEFMKKGAKKAMSIIRQCGSEEEILWAQDTYNTLMQL